MQSIFADHIVNITITGPLVRLDLAIAVTAANAEGKPETRIVPTQQLVMPIDGFVRAFGMQEGIIKKLIADGVLKPQAQPEVQPAGIAAGSNTPQ